MIRSVDVVEVGQNITPFDPDVRAESGCFSFPNRLKVMQKMCYIIIMYDALSTRTNIAGLGGGRLYCS